MIISDYFKNGNNQKLNYYKIHSILLQKIQFKSIWHSSVFSNSVQYFFFFPTYFYRKLIEIEEWLMTTKLQEKYKQIFEVKIKQDRLSQLLQNFSAKIHKLEEGQRCLEFNLSINNILDQVKLFVKSLVKEESTQILYKFYEKADTCTKQINRVEYSFKNIEKNIRDQFESLNEKERLLEKTVSYMNMMNMTEGEKIKKDLETLRQQLEQGKKLMSKQFEENKQRIDEMKEEISALHETVESGEKRIEQFQENIQSITENRKENIRKVEPKHEKPHSKHQIERQKLGNHLSSQLIKKPRINVRKTIDNTQKSSEAMRKKMRESQDIKQIKQGQQIRQSQCNGNKQQQYFALPKKVQKPQKRASNIIQISSNERQILLSTQQLSQLPKADSNKNIDRIVNKSSSIRKVNQFKRGSIRTEQNHEPIYNEEYVRSSFANHNQNQIRRINDKLTNISFKITLVEQNYQTLLVKMNKLANLEAVVQGKIDEAEKMRIDANTVNEIKLRFKQIQTAMQLQELRYVNHSTYQKQIESIHRRLYEIDGELPKFANKQEVIAAFSFIEKKIKEIVTVLSDKFEEDKLGAINKIQNIKCLSCDKQANFADLPRNHKNNIRNSLVGNNRVWVERQEIIKRIKTQQNQMI